MSFVIRRIYEYDMVCDKCGCTEVLHTGDYVEQDNIFVHNRNTAMKAGEYHNSRGMLLCDNCFRQRNK